MLEDQAEAAFRDKGMRWTDSRNAAPGIESFVDRIGSFLVLVGLAGLAVGGVGISSAVRSYLEGKVETIATLKTLGAEGGLIFRIYLWQIGASVRLRHRDRRGAWGCGAGPCRAADRGVAAVPGRDPACPDGRWRRRRSTARCRR